MVLSSGTLNLSCDEFTLTPSSLLWNNLPREINESLSSEEFIKRLKNTEPFRVHVQFVSSLDISQIL